MHLDAAFLMKRRDGFEIITGCSFYQHWASPVPVHALECHHVTQVQCGRWHTTLALMSRGYVFTWLCAEADRLGIGKSMVKSLSVPYLVE